MKECFTNVECILWKFNKILWRNKKNFPVKLSGVVRAKEWEEKHTLTVLAQSIFISCGYKKIVWSDICVSWIHVWRRDVIHFLSQHFYLPPGKNEYDNDNSSTIPSFLVYLFSCWNLKWRDIYTFWYGWKVTILFRNVMLSTSRESTV